MKQFRVTLGALAYVSQKHLVEAETAVEAYAKALGQTGDYVWAYDELKEGTEELLEFIEEDESGVDLAAGEEKE